MPPLRLFRPWNTATRCGARIHAALAAGLLLLLLPSVATAQRTKPTAEDIVRVREIDPELKKHQEACVSDPAATAAAIEKAGYVFEKLEHLDRINRKIYVLTLRPSRALPPAGAHASFVD